MEQLIDTTVELLKNFGPKLIGAIVILVIGLWLVKVINRGIKKFMEKKELSPSLRPFLQGLISILLKALLFISVLSIIGIPMSSFIALLAAAGLAVGMALSGTLQNFAGGVMILTFRPYLVGDFIEALGYSGTVHEIQIFNTILKTPEAFIAVSELADSSVNLAVRVWVKAEDYWSVFFNMNEKVYKTFDKEKLNIPYPQMDVHLHQ